MLQSTKRIFICPFLKGGESENFCKVDSGDIKMINHQWKPFVTHLSACLNVWLCYAKELLKNEAWQTLFEWYPGETSIEDEIIWGAPFMFKAKDLGYLTVTTYSSFSVVPCISFYSQLWRQFNYCTVLYL